MPREIAKSASQEVSSPDYVGLVKFLLEPFLSEAESLHVHCEHLTSTNKIWLRVAFDTAEKGKVFGRGGRNVQAVSTILKTAAKSANHSLHLDVYNSERTEEQADSPPRRKSRPNRPSPSRPNRPENKNNKIIL